MSKTAYVGGPMTNRPRFNFDTFDAVTAALRAQGWTVFNPHEHDQEVYPGIDDAKATITGDVPALVEEIGFTLATSMAWDLARVVEADAIVLLPGWEGSTGAKAERFVAEATGSLVLLAVQGSSGQWVTIRDFEQKRMAVEVAK